MGLESIHFLFYCLDLAFYRGTFNPKFYYASFRVPSDFALLSATPFASGVSIGVYSSVWPQLSRLEIRATFRMALV